MDSRPARRLTRRVSGVVALVLCAAACGMSEQQVPSPFGPTSSSGVTQPSPPPAAPVPAPAPAPEPTPPPTPVPEPVTGVMLRRFLTTAIEQEYRTGTTYAAVLVDHGRVSPFVEATVRQAGHANAVATLFEARNWPVPPNASTLANVARFPLVSEACTFAEVAELQTASMYRGFLETYDLPRDVRATFSDLREAALTVDLPAFHACAR